MAMTRKTVAENSAATPPPVAGDIVTIDEITSKLGFSNPGPIQARLERDGVTIVRNWLGLRAVSAQAAHDVYWQWKAEQEENSEMNRAYAAYQEQCQRAVWEKQREEVRKQKAAQDAAVERHRDADAAQKAAAAQAVREAQIAAQGAPVSFDEFRKGAR